MATLYRRVLIGLAFCFAPLAFAGGYGFDVALRTSEYAGQLAKLGMDGSSGTWMRVRSLTEENPADAGNAAAVAQDRAGLRMLRKRGVRTMVILRWDPKVWNAGVRPGGGYRLPLDLREAYDRARSLAVTYGDVLDGWEIDNEPDIDFVRDNPEVYAAFLKAMYLGIKAGVAAAPALDGASGREGGPVLPEPSTWLERKRGMAPLSASTQSVSAPTGLVVMAPLALPPGPYFERLCINGLFSYTDGFNFHYYGYAEDFTGVYRQFEDAVERLQGAKTGAGADVRKKSLPVFITEYGYGLLDAEARNTAAGRIRQWRWYATVLDQIRALRPEGPMAFLLNPYYEADLNEFGLTAPGGMKLDEDGLGLRNEALAFRPSDFGQAQTQPWMRRIGKEFAGNHATPALAYMWDYAKRNPYRPRGWTVKAEPASPLVIDFIADKALAQMKSSGGYLAEAEGTTRLGASTPTREGQGRLVFYNFSDTEVSGVVTIGGGEVAGSPVSARLTLAPGERRELPATLSVQALRFAGEECRVIFRPEAGAVPAAIWATRLFPGTLGMKSTLVTDFGFDAGAAAERRAALLRRTTVVEEPVLQQDGRWLKTEGVRVEERDGVWRFHIDHMPAEAVHSAVVELPLPVDFKVEPESMILFERRAVAVAGVPEAVVVAAEDARRKSRAGTAGAMMGVGFRSENGNLYQIWPRMRITDEWTGYVENLENFTMMFFGRAELPWRFTESRPASLVFVFRPGRLPALVEVRKPRITKVGR